MVCAWCASSARPDARRALTLVDFRPWGDQGQEKVLARVAADYDLARSRCTTMLDPNEYSLLLTEAPDVPPGRAARRHPLAHQGPDRFPHQRRHARRLRPAGREGRRPRALDVRRGGAQHRHPEARRHDERRRHQSRCHRYSRDGAAQPGFAAAGRREGRRAAVIYVRRRPDHHQPNSRKSISAATSTSGSTC